MRETKLREALLAQQFEDLDQLADKISGVASRIERSTARLNTLSAPLRAPIRKSPIGWLRAMWENRGQCAAAVIGGIIVSAGIGALIARSMPSQTAEQAQVSDVGRAVVRAWVKLDTTTQTKVWNLLDPQAQEALASSVRRR